MATLVQGVRGNRDRFVAVAFVSDVRTSESDAVRVELEHSEGPAMAVLLHYRKRRLRKGVEYGRLAGMASTRAVWS